MKASAGAFVLGLTILSWMPAAGAQEATGEPIKIGAIFALTGAGAGLGKAELNGALLAEKQINKTGGVNGRPIKLIRADDATNADTALAKANDLAFNEKVVAIIGPSQTASTVAVGGVTDPLMMPQLPFSGIGPEVEKSRKCVLHMAPQQVLNAKAMLSYARATGFKKVAALYDSGFGSVVFPLVQKFASDYGVEIIASEKFEIAATDTTAQVAKLRAAQPDAIFVMGITGTPIRNIRALQMTQPIVATIGQATYAIAASMGEHVSDVVIGEFLVAEDPLERQKEFVELYKAEYGSLPMNAEALAWDSVHAIAAALRKIGPEPAKGVLCDALRGPYSGVTAEFDFSAPDMTGLTLGQYVFAKLVDGKFTRLPFVVKD